jgi:hypothetical protein
MKLIFASFILTMIAIVQSATLRDETNISTQIVRREASQIQHSDSQNIAAYLVRSLDSQKREASPNRGADGRGAKTILE